MSANPAREPIDLAFHWAPMSRRKGIERRGLAPGSRSRGGEWRPPFVCLARDPAYAIASSNAQVPIEEPMDLWQVNLATLPFPREEVRLARRDPVL